MLLGQREAYPVERSELRNHRGRPAEKLVTCSQDKSSVYRRVSFLSIVKIMFETDSQHMINLETLSMLNKVKNKTENHYHSY